MRGIILRMKILSIILIIIGICSKMTLRDYINEYSLASSIIAGCCLPGGDTSHSQCNKSDTDIKTGKSQSAEYARIITFLILLKYRSKERFLKINNIYKQ